MTPERLAARAQMQARIDEWNAAAGKRRYWLHPTLDIVMANWGEDGDFGVISVDPS